MSNLTKLEVLKHRHLSLLKKLEEHGIAAHYSQVEGEWQITMPSPEITSIDVSWDAMKEDWRKAFLAEPLPPKTIMGIPVVNIESFRIHPVDEKSPLEQLRAWLFNNVHPDGPILFGIDLGEDANEQERSMADALSALREAPRLLYSGKCPLNFGGAPNFTSPPDSTDTLRESMLAAGIRSMIGVKDDEVLSVGAVGVYRVPLTPSLYHLTEATHHAILSAASAKA